MQTNDLLRGELQYRLILATHSAMRSLGFPAEDIYVMVAKNPCVGLKHSGREFIISLGGDLCKPREQFLEEWTYIAKNNHEITDETLQRAGADWEELFTRKELIIAIMRKGIPCLTNLKMVISVKVNKKSGQMAKDLAATAGAIGMTTTTRVRRSKGKVKALAYNGVAPTVVNVEAGTYPFTREAYLVTKADPSAKVRAFLDFVKSAEGGEVWCWRQRDSMMHGMRKLAL